MYIAIAENTVTRPCGTFHTAEQIEKVIKTIEAQVEFQHKLRNWKKIKGESFVRAAQKAIDNRDFNLLEKMESKVSSEEPSIAP
jgi:hypothetical protein